MASKVEKMNSHRLKISQTKNMEASHTTYTELERRVNDGIDGATPAGSEVSGIREAFLSVIEGGLAPKTGKSNEGGQTVGATGEPDGIAKLPIQTGAAAALRAYGEQVNTPPINKKGTLIRVVA